MKPAGLSVKPPAVPRFPLGKTGGLIEAVADTAMVRTTRRRFRWVKPAASLKGIKLCKVSSLYGVSAG